MAVLDDVLNHILNLSTGKEEDYDVSTPFLGNSTCSALESKISDTKPPLTIPFPRFRNRTTGTSPQALQPSREPSISVDDHCHRA